MKDATAGQMVTYRHLHRGGYGYETCHPAVVVRLHGRRATIRVARRNVESGTLYPAEAVVTLARLSPRAEPCEVEDVLNTAPNPEATQCPAH